MNISTTPLTSTDTSNSPSFYEELKREVHKFLADQKLKPQGPWQMYMKTVSIISLWFATYIFLLLWGSQSVFVIVTAVSLLSFFTLCVEMGVMHDASHRSWSKSNRLNRFMGVTLFLAGCSSIMWYQKHVIAHHGHTNVPGEDHDIESGGLFRFHSGDDWHFWHKFQHFYATALYSLLVLKWIYIDDFRDAIRNRYQFSGSRYLKMWMEIVLSRLSHLLLFIIIPYLFIDHIGLVIGIYLVHWMAVGIILAFVFQLAHISKVQEYPETFSPSCADWARHQLETTADFAVKNKFLTWFAGGLNFQVEHHIFPRISHIHYPKIQPIVKQLCEKHNIPYFEYPTFFRALAAHFAQLKALSCRSN